MTEQEREAEKVKSLASCVYRALETVYKAERYIRTIHKKHSQHPAFQQYMKDMMLENALNDVTTRAPLKERF